MNNKKFPYEKINFALSVLGFIGSVAFYIGVLNDMKTNDAKQQEIDRLKVEVAALRKQLLQK